MFAILNCYSKLTSKFQDPILFAPHSHLLKMVVDSEWGMVSGRLAPYWATIATSLFILSFLYVVMTDDWFTVYEEEFLMPVSSI